MEKEPKFGREFNFLFCLSQILILITYSQLLTIIFPKKLIIILREHFFSYNLGIQFSSD